jgi:hypothetical protein
MIGMIFLNPQQQFADAIRRDKENTDFVYNWIEEQIKFVVDSFPVPEADIVKELETRNISNDNIFLIMNAARLLYKDQTSTPPKKTSFKRVP